MAAADEQLLKKALDTVYSRPEAFPGLYEYAKVDQCVLCDRV